MRCFSFAALCACAAILCPSSNLRADEADRQKLQGKWNVESFEYNGKPVEAMKGAAREFKDDTYKLTPTSGDTFEGTFKLDESQKPRQIDLKLPDRTLKGIYEVDGDVLKISYALEGDARPTELVSKADSGVVLVVHKRAK